MKPHDGTVPPKRSRVSTNIAFAMAGRGYIALTQFLTLVVVARMGTTEDVAALALAAAIVTPLFFLASMGMREAHTVDDLDHFTRADYVGLRLFTGTLSVALATLAAFAVHTDAPMVLWSTVAFAVVKFFGAQMSLNQGIFQRAERLDLVALSNLGRGTAGLVVFAAVFWATRNLAVALAFEALAWAASNLVVDRPQLVRLGNWVRLRDLMGVSILKMARLAIWVLPLGVTLFLMRGALSVPTLMLERFADLATVGVFGAMAYVHSALSMLTNTFGSSVAARMRGYYRTGKRRAFVRLTLMLCAFAATMAVMALILAMLVGDPLLALVFGDAYRRADLLVLIICATGLSMSAAPAVAAINASQMFRPRLISGAAGFAAAIIASLLFVPEYKEVGAAWAMIALTFTQTAVNLSLFGLALRRMPMAGDTGAAG